MRKVRTNLIIKQRKDFYPDNTLLKDFKEVLTELRDLSLRLLKQKTITLSDFKRLEILCDIHQTKKIELFRRGVISPFDPLFSKDSFTLSFKKELLILLEKVVEEDDDVE